MVTGAGGSIGSELCRQLSRLGPGAARAGRPLRAGAVRGRPRARPRARLPGRRADRGRRQGRGQDAPGLRQVPPGRRLPRGGVQARGDDGGEPDRGRAQQHARHADARRRRGRVRRQAVRARLDGQGREPEDDHGPVEGALRVDRGDVGASQRRLDPVRGRALRQRARLVRLGDPDLPPPDREGRAGDGDAPGDDTVLHDDPRGGAARRPGGCDRRARPGLRARHGRARADHGPGREHDPALRQGAGNRDPDRGDRAGAGREAARGARRRRRGRLAEPAPEDRAHLAAARRGGVARRRARDPRAPRRGGRHARARRRAEPHRARPEAGHGRSSWSRGGDRL